jgi:putative ABC transport system permease protein
MLKNYLKTAWRNLWKNKIFSAINVIGLAIGMAACIIILLFVFYERSFDGFHSKNLYRLNEVQKFEGMVASQKVALSMFPMGPTLQSEFPEIKNYTRINLAEKIPLNYGEKQVFIQRTCFVDSTFLQLFDFALVKGDRHTALEKKNTIVLTRATAEKFFGKEDPMGKTLVSYEHDTSSLVVTGVLENVLPNSQIQFDALVPFSTISQPEWMDNWGGNWLNTYLELAPNTNIAALEKKFPAYLKKHMTEGDGWKNYELFLLPLKDVHSGATDVGLDNFNYQQFDKKYTNIFFIIALVVLLIACVNFMNLSTARSAERAREVGVRKSIGASRWQLANQFLGESIMLSLIAMLSAVALVKLFLPSVNHLSQRELAFPLFSNWKLLLTLIAGTVMLGIVSGLYPAAYLSSFQPVKVLKGSVQIGKNKGALRNILVVTQFACAIFLIIATVFAVRQLNYMRNRPTGFDREQVVIIPFDRGGSRKFDILKKDLLQNTLVSAVTASQDVLGSHLDQSGIEFKGDGPLRQLTSTRLIVDHDYLTLYKIPLAAGRNFSSEKSAEGKEYIINESLAKELLKDDSLANVASLLGRRFGFDSIGSIVGIAKDFNFNSLHHKIETMFLFNQTEWGFGNMSVKINGSKSKEALAFIQSVWQKNAPDKPFEYQFLDDHFAELYRADSQISTIVGTLAILAIIVSCLGLFGLASYSASKRIREVGIRKVMGASTQSIVSLLSRDFLKLILVANLVAWPIAWFALNKWMQDYAYRIPISWWVFIIAGCTALLIALLTVSFQAIKAAIANPVKSLRSE